MADPQPHPDDDVGDPGLDRESTTPSTPRGVKVAVIVVVGVVVLIIVLHLTGTIGPGAQS